MEKRDFIERATKVHNGRYDYSLVPDRFKAHDKVQVVCFEHGVFTQDAQAHLRGQGCPKCRGGVRYTQDTFIEKAVSVHGSRYDFSKAVYVNSATPVTVICPEHGEFNIRPDSLLAGKGCQKCALRKRNLGHRTTQDKFLDKAAGVWGSRYDFSKAVYTKAIEPITVICPQHGEFVTTPHSILAGHGCPECARKKTLEARTDDRDTFIRKARAEWGDEYDYSKVEYVRSNVPVTIICRKHGEFTSRPGDHINQHCGCPSCSHSVSRPETDIFRFVKELCPDAVQRDRKTIAPLELDIFVPSRNVAVEYNGVVWHSERFSRHPLIEKTELCEARSIRLIHIFEDEWLERPEVVKSKLRHILGCDDAVRVHGRKLSVRSVDKETGDKFLNRFHIQGSGQATVRLGAYYSDELVAVMYFKRTDSDGRWELTRFATHDGYNVVGGAGKLFCHFVRTYGPSAVKSFADRRWTSMIRDNVYTRLGFTLAEVLKPDYRYVVNGRRVHKFNFRKRLLLARYPDVLSPDMTEREMTEKLGFYRIYDCGLLRYEWKKPDQ